MSDLARSLLGLLSGRHRRWRRLLRSLALDPDRLERPVEEPGERDFIICGSSRSGTSLLTAMLFQPPRVVTVMEPWDGMRLPPAELFRSLREEIGTTGALSRGKLDLEALRDRRVRWWQEGRSAPIEVHEGFRLGVKWPAFWRYLDLLPSTRFLVCVRHPYDTIASFQAKGGRLGEGLDYDIPFNARMNATLAEATSDTTTRRILMYEYVNRVVAAHRDDSDVLLVRYEDWFEDPAKVLAEVGAFLGVDLGSPPIDVRPPQSGVELDEAARALVREHCPSAIALGYEL